MKLRLVPPRHGVLWVRSGFRIFFRRPMAYGALFTVFMLGVAALLLVPLVGALVLLVALPLVTQAFMLATQRALLERPVLPGVFTEPLRAGRPQARAMLQIGLAYMVASLAVMWFSGVADGGRFEAFEDAVLGGKADPKQVEALLADPRLLFGIVLRLGLTSLLALPFWHAPPLVHWGGLPWSKALFFSTMACWRNKGAFAAYALTWFAVIVAFGVFVNVVFIAIGQPRLIGFAALTAGLMFSTVFYASLYFSFADCFEYQLDVGSPDSLTPRAPS